MSRPVDLVDSDDQDASTAELSPRKKSSYWKARHSDLEIHEGDDRGAVFFGEFEARKLLTKAMERAWDDLLLNGCKVHETLEAYENADRCKCETSERKEFEGLLRFQVREMERVRLGHAEHSYINFVSPCFIEQQAKKHAHVQSSTSSSHTNDHHGEPQGAPKPHKKRASVALTTFHRDLMDFQDLVEVGSEEQAERLEIVLEWCGELASFASQKRLE
ncbi:Hypothetical protein, putative [Bodo saltans]|uniref:Uncharacterized protein n=1 Tax=Bodo saltans TaxID=75058 RepID=A0A0S4JGC3_BODSA|nr:Hypothetical protein, putative [Bodo saltans]|eukprot:CUG89160.1 Hypothetical protein, putative [Bodo saltans]